MCLTIKNNQRTLRRQVVFQFEGKRHIPFVAKDHEKRHGRDTIWTLRAKEAPDHIKENWPGSAWIVEVNADTIHAQRQTGAQAAPVHHQPENSARSIAAADPAALEH